MIHDDDIECLRVPAAQLALLKPYRVTDVLQRHGQSAHVARNLHYRGLLSFDPDEVGRLSPAEEAELDFLAGIARVVGLRGIDGVLEGLTRPYAYPLSELLYDFAAARWCVRPEDRQEVA